MTELVLVSDVHGNHPALQAVVEVEGDDASYVVLGDIHGLLGYPKETMDLVWSLDARILAGNHDKAIFHHNEGHVNSPELSAFELEHTLNELTSRDVGLMQKLQYMAVWKSDGDVVCACHALPWPEKASGYEAGNAGIKKGDVPHYASVVADDYDWVFHGHTHEQYDLDASRWGHPCHFVNPGSLGYNGTYSVVDTATGDVTHKSVEIDWDEVKVHVQGYLSQDAPHTEAWL